MPGGRWRPVISHRIALLLIVCVALLARLLHVLASRPRPAAGLEPSPVYLLAQAALQSALPGEAGWAALGILQAAAGAATVWLVARLARRLHSRRAGLAAGLLACFGQHHLFMAGSFLAANLSTPLLLLALLTGLRALRRRSPRSLALAGSAAGAAFWTAGASVAVAPLLSVAALGGGPGRGRRLFAAVAGAAAVTTLVVAAGAGAGLPLSPFPSTRVSAEDPWGAIYEAGREHWSAFWEARQPEALRSLNPSLMVGEVFFPWISWRLVLWTGLLGLGITLSRRPRAGRHTLAAAILFIACYMVFHGDASARLPLEGILLAWSGAAVAEVLALVPAAACRRTAAWSTAASVLLLAVVTQASASALMVRRGLAEPSSLLATAGPARIEAGTGGSPVFGEDPLRLDRSRGRYLRLDLMARRTVPDGMGPFQGEIRIAFLHADGQTRSWLDTPSLRLGGLPPGRWVPVSLKAHIPPSAVACSVEIVSPRLGNGPLLLDHARLRYSGGNDLALEFLFPYLRAER